MATDEQKKEIVDRAATLRNHPAGPPIEDITISKHDTGEFIVTQGELDSGPLTWDELIGQIVSLTVPPKFTNGARYVMETDEQREQQREQQRERQRSLAITRLAEGP